MPPRRSRGDRLRLSGLCSKALTYFAGHYCAKVSLRGTAKRNLSVVVCCLAIGLLGACGQTTANEASEVEGLEATSSNAPTEVLVKQVKFPAALLAEPTGSLLFGERLTGQIRRITPAGELEPEPVATVQTLGSEDDQRGLLGLVLLPDSRLVASWTRSSDNRLVAGVVFPAAEAQLIWEGPVSADRANGGGLALSAESEVLIGIGDLLADPNLAEDETVPNRKILALDPNGLPDQLPKILSTGWNNPFAIAVAPDGTPWVADNSAGDNPERIGRADRPASEAAALSTDGLTIAPSGLVALGSDRFGLCGYVSKQVEELNVREGRAERTGRVLADTCWTSVAALPDGRIVTATLDEIRVAVSAT